MKQEIKYIEGYAGNFRLLGFATGKYFCICRICRNRFIGDKRSVMCLLCAIEEIEKNQLPNNPKELKIAVSTIDSLVKENCLCDGAWQIVRLKVMEGVK